ncbi:MAG: 2-dehydro-3-deoxygalactonokinase [Bacteroidota bacterium]
MSNPNTILCIDWGTSSFRAALVEIGSQKVTSSFQSDRGCKVVFQESLEKQTDPFDFFTQELQGLLRQHDLQQSDYEQIIISGMASSSIGMKELPYASLPFSMNGSGVLSETMEVRGLGKITLISGVADKEDIMRGEETQLLGLCDHLDLDNSTLIFPGTHSKHMKVRNGELVGFKTYLTGELFQLVSEQSILNRSVMKSTWSLDFKLPFSLGVDEALKENLLNSLFRIRARDILGKDNNSSQNYFYLSGLIIGNELRGLVSVNGKKIYACDGKMKSLYQQAVNQLGISDATFLATEELAYSYINGQLSILKHL